MPSLTQPSAHRKAHGQYYTQQAIGSLLVDRLAPQSVRQAIEFGVGPGALLDAVSRRWPEAHCISVDIDPAHRRKSNGSRAHFCADALKPDISRRIGLEPGSADVAVCNPPFITPIWRPEFARILSRTGLLPKHTASGFGADLLFLAQNLWMLKPEGQLGIIVPSGIICGERSQPLREWLLERHCVSEVIELPAGSFTGTEVKTFVLCLTKDKTTNDKILLSRVSTEGALSPSLYVTPEEASFRLDHAYHDAKIRSHFCADVSSISERRFEVLRGNLSLNDAHDSVRGHLLHTTDISATGMQRLRLRRLPAEYRELYVTAKRGDVVIARVGRECFKKVAYIERGEAVVSDCLFVVRSNRDAGLKIQAALRSEAGAQWLSMHSRGACARFITKRDLEMFPMERMLGP